MKITFTVHGKPQPAGSKSSFVPINKKTGQPYRSESGRVVVNTVDANKNAKPWQSEVRAAARAVHQGELLCGDLAVTMRFYVARPKGHFGTGKNAAVLKASAPARPSVKPDVLKLARAVEDALTNQVYGDDAQIVDEVLSKFYGTPERVEIEIEVLEHQRQLAM